MQNLKLAGRAQGGDRRRLVGNSAGAELKVYPANPFQSRINAVVQKLNETVGFLLAKRGEGGRGYGHFSHRVPFGEAGSFAGTTIISSRVMSHCGKDSCSRSHSIGAARTNLYYRFFDVYGGSHRGAI